MIMKKEFCMMAIGLLLAGCSADEEIANVQTSEANAISFNVVGKIGNVIDFSLGIFGK